MLSSEDMKEEKEAPIIRKTWRSNKISNTILISLPNSLALKHGITVGSNLVIEDRPDGILFKNLVIKE